MIKINFGPNYMTFECVHFKGRKKNFLNINLKSKSSPRLEFSGQMLPIPQIADFKEDVLANVVVAFNQYSNKQI